VAGQAVMALIDAGVEVRVERADGPGGLAAALRRLEERWGRIDGIVDSLGVENLGDLAAVGEARAATWKLEIDIIEQHLGVLKDALAGRAPEFVLVESSLAGVLGSFGRVRVAMANALTDAYASIASADGVRWTSVAWDRWTTGDVPEGDDLWITAPEIAPSLAAVLALAGEPNVLVSTGDLDMRIRQSARVSADTGVPSQLYARPEDLGTEYEPPSNELEERIADVWQALLGVQHVGIHDDFFALGGHSLLATQIIARLKDMFELELPLKVIFEAPTVAKMAVLVEEAILAEIEGLSEDEAAELVG
jgi:acyl carrier protein